MHETGSEPTGSLPVYTNASVGISMRGHALGARASCSPVRASERPARLLVPSWHTVAPGVFSMLARAPDILPKVVYPFGVEVQEHWQG